MLCCDRDPVLVLVYMRATRLVHVILCCTGTLWLGNAAYLYLSVSFIQMLKALMPVAVFCTGCTFGIESFGVGALANMVINSSTLDPTLVLLSSHGRLWRILTSLKQDLTPRALHTISQLGNCTGQGGFLG